MRRLGIYEKAPSKAKKAQETEVTIAKYPVERYYQYTAIDEYIRKRYTYFTKAHSTYESTKFLEKVIKYYKFKIKLIQTDNGYEFTNRLSWRPTEKNKKTMLEKKLEELGIEYSLIRPNTPTQNGKVERRHRKAQEYFYHNNIFISLEDLREKGKRWRIEYNNFPMRPLGWLSPNESKNAVTHLGISNYIILKKV